MIGVCFMSYYGENSRFVFANSFCEPISGKNFSVEDSVAFGKALSREFKKIAVSFDNQSSVSQAMAMCAGISDSGCTAFLCPDTNMSALKYSLNLIDADCGVFISEHSSPKFNLVRKNGFSLSKKSMTNLLCEDNSGTNTASGEIINVSSMNSLYIQNLKSFFNSAKLPANVGISCGNCQIRSLWKNFFAGKDDGFVFHVSDDGQTVNGFDMKNGFISYERLILAYCLMFADKSREIYLPEWFHFSAEKIADSYGISIKRFNTDAEIIPENAAKQRFLIDPLFMCLNLSQNPDKLSHILSEIPKFAVIKRDIPLPEKESSLIGSSFSEKNSRISIQRNGKNTLALIIQSHDAETAAEIAENWKMKLKS